MALEMQKVSDQADAKNYGKSDHWLEKLPALPDKIVREPYDYLASLPSKKTLSVFIDGFNAWYGAPASQVDIIKSVCESLLNASLLIDDIEDNSDLRRGQPAAHMIFGVPQSINSANYLLMKCFEETCKLSLSAVAILAEESCRAHIGQGYDLHWTFHGEVPSEREYLRMIDGKTGTLLMIAFRLTRDQATRNKDLDIEDFVRLSGRFYQIRDDYMNLKSQDYTKSKGHFSDLDEGKYSPMLIHALNDATEGTKLKSLLAMRSRQGSLSAEQKDAVMQILARTKSVEYTQHILENLQSKINSRLEFIENQVGENNQIFRAALAKLQVLQS